MLYKFNYYEYDPEADRYTEFHDYGIKVVITKSEEILEYGRAKLITRVEALTDEGWSCNGAVRDGTDTFGRVYVVCWETEQLPPYELIREIEIGFIYRRID